MNTRLRIVATLAIALLVGILLGRAGLRILDPILWLCIVIAAVIYAFRTAAGGKD